MNLGATVRRTLIVAASLLSTRCRGAGMEVASAGSGAGADPGGMGADGAGMGADPAGTSTVPPLVTVSAVTFARSRKVARKVLC